MKKVVTVGSATIDILVRSNDFRILKSHQVSGGMAMCEVFGGKTEANEICMDTGGSATNVAAGLSRLGTVSAVIARIGDDWTKERIMSSLAVEGVETSLIQVEKGGATALSVVLIAPGGGRSIITYRGSGKKIESNEVDWNKVGQADWIQIGPLGGNLSLLDDLIAFAKKKKIKIGFNPGRGELVHQERIMKLMSSVELLILNRLEAAMLLKTEYGEINLMARKILKNGVKVLAITDGVRGAGLASGGFLVSASAYKTRSVDDTGAGDAFTAAVVAGILQQKDLETCLKMGLANGANQVTEIGAKSGLLDKEKMQKWLKKRKVVVEERL